MDPDEDVLLEGLRQPTGLRGDQPEAERDVLLVIELRLEEVHVEEAVLRLHGHRGLHRGLDQGLVAAPVLDQIRDRADLEVVLLREDLELGHARHRPVVVHDLADHAGRRAAGQAREIDDALGLASPYEDAAVPRPQGEDVARTGQIGRGRVGPDRLPDGVSAVRGADARGDAAGGLDGDREGRPVCVGVVGGLHRQLELVAERTVEGHADQPPALLGHEVDVVRGDELREHREVALVLAIGVVHEDHHAPLGEVLDAVGDG